MRKAITIATITTMMLLALALVSPWAGAGSLEGGEERSGMVRDGRPTFLWDR